MAESKSLLTVVFAAGVAAGGGGATVMDNPEPTSYMAAGIVEAIQADCMDEACQTLRKWQWGQLVDDLEEDVIPDETFKLGELSLYVAERIDYDEDAPKELWAQEALDTINARLAIGYTEGDISPDDTMTGEAFVAMLDAARG